MEERQNAYKILAGKHQRKEQLTP